MVCVGLDLLLVCVWCYVLCVGMCVVRLLFSYFLLIGYYDGFVCYLWLILIWLGLGVCCLF